MNYETMIRSAQIFMKRDPNGEIGICPCGCARIYGPPDSDVLSDQDVAELVAMGWVFEESGYLGSTEMCWVYR